MGTPREPGRLGAGRLNAGSRKSGGMKQHGSKGPKSRIMIASLVILLCVGVLAVILIVFPFNREIVAMEQANADNIVAVNSQVTDQYVSVMYPQGSARIAAELEKLRQIPDPRARLDEIFVWEMDGWIEPDENLSAFACINNACTYAYLKDNPARLKASPYIDGVLYPQKNPDGTFYADDPVWIAYNKIGECREYSTLFSYMAEQSGLDARIVRTNSHQWVEVELNGESYYYDPWCAETHDYYNATDGNMTFRDKWFNRIGNFESSCHHTDEYLITYNGFPYIWATPKYMLATGGYDLSMLMNGTLSSLSGS